MFLIQAIKKTRVDISSKENCRGYKFRGKDQELGLEHFKSEMPIRYPSGNIELLSLLYWSRSKYALYPKEGQYRYCPRLFAKQTSVKR